MYKKEEHDSDCRTPLCHDSTQLLKLVSDFGDNRERELMYRN